MKKTALTLFALSLLSVAGYAQGFYLRAGLGYAFPQAGQTMYDSPIPYNGFPTGINGTRNNGASNYTYNIKAASFSAGMQVIPGIGYMFSKNIGLELDACIGLSTKQYTFSDQNVALGTGGGSTILGNITTTQQAKTPVLLSPLLVLQTGGDKVNLYTRFGVALPLNTKVTQDQAVSNAPGTGALEVDDYNWQIKSGFSLGFTAAAGVKYKINDGVSIWGELSLLSMSAYTKEQDLKSISEDGQSISLNAYPYPQKIKFSKTAVVDSNYGAFPTYAQSFSNLAINVGVTFTFSHHERHHSARNNDDIDNNKPFRRR